MRARLRYAYDLAAGLALCAVAVAALYLAPR